MHKLKRFGNHVLVWAIWNFMLCSWAIVTWQKQPALPLIYNLSSLIVVFYATRWMAGLYWKQIENQTQMSIDDKGMMVVKPNFRFYVMQWPVLGVVAIIFIYIITSWLVDGLFASNGQLPGRVHGFYIYTYAKWVSVSTMILGGNVMAAIEYDKREQKKRENLLENTCRQRLRVINSYKDSFDEYLIKYMPGYNPKDFWKNKGGE